MIDGIELSDLLLRNKDFRFTGVPCSLLKPITDPLFENPAADYLIAANEGDAIAIASGYYLGGKFGVVTLQNSGLGNAVNPLTSLNSIFDIPIGMLISLRGDSSSYSDEPQHKHMGEITEQLLRLLKIPVFSNSTLSYNDFYEWCKVMPLLQKPSAFLVGRNQVQIREISNKRLLHSSSIEKEKHQVIGRIDHSYSNYGKHNRVELLEYLLGIIENQDILVSTTGYTSRELNTIGDRNLNFYTVGSMGCASSIALGISLVCKNRVIVLDGDGAGLMRMSALSTIGFVNPSNLIHIMLDNGIHESTGSQPTASTHTVFGQVAKSCGYENVIITNELKDIEKTLNQSKEGTTFIHFKIKPGVLKNLGRPTITPKENTIRLRESLKKN